MITTLRVRVSDSETLEVSWTNKAGVSAELVAAMARALLAPAMARALLAQGGQPKVTDTAGVSMLVDPPTPYVRLAGGLRGGLT